MKEFGPIHTLWSASEEDLGDTLKGIASSIDQCCKAMEKRMEGLSENLFPTLHEYVLYSEILMVSWHRCGADAAFMTTHFKGTYFITTSFEGLQSAPCLSCVGGMVLRGWFDCFLYFLSSFLTETQGQIRELSNNVIKTNAIQTISDAVKLDHTIQKE